MTLLLLFTLQGGAFRLPLRLETAHLKLAWGLTAPWTQDEVGGSPFLQQMLTEHLLCAPSRSRQWGHGSGHRPRERALEDTG